MAEKELVDRVLEQGDLLPKNKPTVGELVAEVRKNNVSDMIQQQKQAQLTLRAERERELEGITSWEVEKNDIISMARLLSKTLRKGQGFYSVEESLVLAMHWKQTGLNPYMGEIFILDSGRIGLSVQGELKEAQRAGHKLGAPKFLPMEREWPKWNGKPIELQRKQGAFSLDMEPGMKCEITVDGQPVEYTAWLTEWHMPANPNWFDRRTHMLMIRSFGNALAFGTGVSLSQDFAAGDSSDNSSVDLKVTSPKNIPTVK